MAECVRRAWLDLTGDGSRVVPLEDPAAGYRCEKLDLGFPEVRDVVNNRPDQNGIDDRTQYLGARVVSADLTVQASWGAQIDVIPGLFAPYMIPSARPVLHYVLDRPGNPERVLTVRGSGFSWPIEGASERAVQLQWVAADPVARDPVTQTVIAWSGSSTGPGRVYPLGFNRTYPPGTGAGTTGVITPGGDVPVRPLLRIYGPVTSPTVTIVGPAASFQIFFRAGYVIAAGQWVDIDCATKNVYANSDPTVSAATWIDWQRSNFAALAPGVNWNMTLTGTSTSSSTQVQAIWNDGYLT